MVQWGLGKDLGVEGGGVGSTVTGSIVLLYFGSTIHHLKAGMFTFRRSILLMCLTVVIA